MHYKQLCIIGCQWLRHILYRLPLALCLLVIKLHAGLLSFSSYPTLAIIIKLHAPQLLLLLYYSCNDYRVTCRPHLLLSSYPSLAIIIKLHAGLSLTSCSSTCYSCKNWQCPSYQGNSLEVVAQQELWKTHWGMLRRNVKIYSKTSFLQGKFTIEDVLRWFGTEILVILKEKSFKSPAGEM